VKIAVSRKSRANLVFIRAAAHFHVRFKKMKSQSTTSPDFIKEALNILQRNGEILVVIRFPYMAGSKDFLFINNEKGFKQLLHK
jgi:hypothetical protein